MNEENKIKQSNQNSEKKEMEHSDSCEFNECSKITQTDLDMEEPE
jgi:hypothetical protein